MSFSLSCAKTGLEYRSTNLGSLFVQRSNLFRPSFYRMIRDILRFFRESRELLGANGHLTPLGDYLRSRGYSREFIEQHIMPLGASVWSADPQTFEQFPAESFVRFFENHGFLKRNGRTPWRVIRGGSREYVKKLVAPFEDRIRLRTPVRAIHRTNVGVAIDTGGGEAERFDDVIIAAHSDQALRMLADATPLEREILGAIPYQPNDVVLHTDTAVLPKRRRAWASWNYHVPVLAAQRVEITYNMNQLQTLDADGTFCVTLNRERDIAPGEVRRRFDYAHPAYSVAAMRAQRRRREISGVRGTHFCGAYWGYGFHEDGVASGLNVCRDFGLELT